MVRVWAKLLLLILLASWCAPAALASYASPQHACCRRAGHHCPQNSERGFRDAKLHCRMCQGLVTAQKAPRLRAAPVAIAPVYEHPFAHEFLSAVPSSERPHEPTGRAPPADPSR